MVGLSIGAGLSRNAVTGFRASASFGVADDFATGVVGTISTSGAEGAVSLVGGAVTDQAGTGGGLFSITTGLEVTFNPQSLGAGLTDDGDNVSVTYAIQLSDTVTTIDVTVRVTLTKPDQAPVAAGALADLTLTIDAAMSAVNVATDFSDADDTLTFTASGLPAGLSLSSAGSLTGTPTSLVTGQAVVITATDAGGQTATSGFSITVGAAPAFTTVFVFPWGQSNTGTGVAASGSTVFPSNTYYWDRDTNAEVDASGATRLFSSKSGSPAIGPAVQWAIRFRADNPTIKIMFVDQFLHATSIEGLYKGTDGYADWIEAIGEAHTAEVNAGETVEFYQVFTQHGESNFTSSENYRHQFRQFIADWRADVQTETGVDVDAVPWTIGMPSDDFIAERSETGPDDIPAIILETPDYVKYTAVADTRTSAVGSGVENVHYTEAGQITNGGIHYDARSTAVANTTRTLPAFTGATPSFALTEDAGGVTLPAFSGATPSFSLLRT